MASASTPRAVVIGSGFGGLALAIRLQASGIATTLLEQRDKPGGRAYVYQDAGFTFDAGPTVITAPGCLEELYTLAGERLADHVDLLPVMPLRADIDAGRLQAVPVVTPVLARQVVLCAPRHIPQSGAAAAVARLTVQLSRDLCARDDWQGAVTA